MKTFEIDGVPFHKTTINIPLSLYTELKQEAKVLGINFNALLLIKLNTLKNQENALDTLNEVLKYIKEKEKIDKLFKGHTNKD